MARCSSHWLKFWLVIGTHTSVLQSVLRLIQIIWDSWSWYLNRNLMLNCTECPACFLCQFPDWGETPTDVNDYICTFRCPSSEVWVTRIHGIWGGSGTILFYYDDDDDLLLWSQYMFFVHWVLKHDGKQARKDARTHILPLGLHGWLYACRCITAIYCAYMSWLYCSGKVEKINLVQWKTVNIEKKNVVILHKG